MVRGRSFSASSGPRRPTKPIRSSSPQQQRETLLQFTQLSRNLKKKIEQAGEGTQIVPVTWNELHKLNDETGQAAVYARSADKKRLMAVMGRVVKFFEEEHAEVFDLEAPKTRKRRPAKTDLLFQFKITLLDIKPAIWRRIQVPDCTLVDLHEYIQAAFGWENYHLHQFEIDGVQYSQPAPDGDDFDMDFEDETDVLLSKLLPKSSQTNPVDLRVRLRRRLAARGSCSRGSRPSNRRRNTRCALKVNEPARQKIAADLRATAITSPPSLIPNTSSTRKCWNGGGRSIRKRSMRRRRRRR